MKKLTEEQRVIRKLEKTEYQKEYRQHNKEHIKEYMKEYRKKKSNAIKIQRREWANRNREQRKKYMKEWEIANAEHRSQYKAARSYEDKVWQDAYNATDKARRAREAYKVANRDKIRQANSIYESKPENKAKKRLRKHKRRSLEKSGKLSPNLIQTLLSSQKRKCIYCGHKISVKHSHLDHIMPLSKGGKNSNSNIQLLCPSCNLKKASKHPIEFAQSIGLLC
jgi:5-methylcytosine-specific restriction endonuclease McrA